MDVLLAVICRRSSLITGELSNNADGDGFSCDGGRTPGSACPFDGGCDEGCVCRCALFDLSFFAFDAERSRGACRGSDTDLGRGGGELFRGALLGLRCNDLSEPRDFDGESRMLSVG